MTDVTVYRVHADAERYRGLLLDASEAEPLLTGEPAPDGSIAAVWRTPPVVIDRPEGESPDIWQLSSLAMTPVMTPSVIERLEPFLSVTGELLPLNNTTSEAWNFLALHVLRVLPVSDCLDFSVGAGLRERQLRSALELTGTENTDEAVRARASRGDPWPYLAPAFIADSLDLPPAFFKIDRLPATLLLLDRQDEPDTLLRRIEAFALNGLVFEQVWSSETGPEDVNLFQ
jgi:hypothetical protein